MSPDGAPTLSKGESKDVNPHPHSTILSLPLILITIKKYIYKPLLLSRTFEMYYKKKYKKEFIKTKKKIEYVNK